MKIAVVDIGSNTIKMKIYKYTQSQLLEIYSDVKNAKLISYIKNRILSDEGIKLLCETILYFKTTALSFDTDIFRCFATASLRRTQNIEEISNTVLKLCQEKIELISGENEAFYSFIGVKNTMPSFPDNCIMIDMGGGSTEIVHCENQTPNLSFSMNFGSLSLYLDFITQGFDNIKNHVYSVLEKQNTTVSDTAVIVGGTALAINKLYCHYFGNKDSNKMSYFNLISLYNTLKKYDDSIIELLNRLVPDRTTTVVTGLAAYIAIFEKYSVKNVYTTTCGIREGYVFEKILKESGAEK